MKGGITKGVWGHNECQGGGGRGGKGKGNQTREASEGGAREKRQECDRAGPATLALHGKHDNGRQIPDDLLSPQFFSKIIYVIPLALSSIITAISYS